MNLELGGKVALVTGAEVLAVPTAVGDDASVQALVEKARERFGRIDILISNASALAVTGERASWDASGIRANALLPGSTEFPGGGWETMRETAPSIYETVRQSVPSGRLGPPKEVADAAVWLVSSRAGWVNGAALVVDGGQSKAIR